jgi:hypothetical protein
MAIRSCLRDCPEVLSPNPYPPRTPGGYIKKLERPGVIHWWAVFAAGGLVWLFVGGLIGAVYVPTDSTGVGKTPYDALRMQLAAFKGFLETPQPTRPVVMNTAVPAVVPEKRISQAVPVQREAQVLVKGQELLRPTSPIQQTRANPPEPVGREDPVTQASRLPVTELAPTEGVSTCETYGTQVSFVDSPADAAQRALKERKLLFMLHLSGNFEDAKFT